MSRTSFRVNPHSIAAGMSRNSLLEAGAKSEVLSDCNWTQTKNHLVHKRVSQCSGEKSLSNQKVHLRPLKSDVTNSILNLFRMGFFGAAHGWGGLFGA